MSHACHRFWKYHKTLTFCSLLERCRIPCACNAKPHLEPSKVVRACGAFNILTWKCASRQNGVHFFDISTSKSGPCMVCCVHFDFETCFAPQRRPLFRQLNFQKCSEREVLLVFSLANVLRVLFIAHLARWLRARRFSEPTFRPSRATNHWKNTMLRDFPTFSRICICFLLTLSLLWSSLFYSSPLWLFPPLLFHLSILSEAWLLNFLRLKFKQVSKTFKHAAKSYSTFILLLISCKLPTCKRKEKCHWPYPMAVLGLWFEDLTWWLNDCVVYCIWFGTGKIVELL